MATQDTTLQYTGNVSYDKDAWELLTHFALRPQLFFDQWATVKATTLAPSTGPTVNFTFTNELALPTQNATTGLYGQLDERTDVDAQTFGDSTIQVVIREFGASVSTTKFLRATSFIPVDPVVANLIGYQSGLTIDKNVARELHGGTNVYYGNGNAGPRTSVPSTSTIKSSDIRKIVAKMREANVMPFGNYFSASIHPDVSYDLRSETGAGAWRQPREYVEPSAIWNGEIGLYESVRFIESPRAVKVPAGTTALASDDGIAGHATRDIYDTLFVGREALAKAHCSGEGLGPNPTVVPGPVVDKLRRFVPMGWYHAVGYKRFREASLRRLETASTLGTNP